MKITRIWLALLVFVLALSLAVPAMAKGGGGGRGFSGGGSRSFSSGGSFKSGGFGKSSAPKTSAPKTSAPKPAPKPVAPKVVTKTYTTPSGKTLSYTPQIYANSRPYSGRSSRYGYNSPVQYYYVGGANDNSWFWIYLWMSGRNPHGTDAPTKAAENVTATTDYGKDDPTGKKVKAVAVPEKSAWSEYSGGDIAAIVAILGSFFGGLGLCLTAGTRALMGKQYKWRFWKKDDPNRSKTYW